MRRLKIAYLDQARRYETLSAGAVVRREPRPYQSEALAAWDAAGGRGVVVLPTGAGKTLVAHMAIDLRRRSTLVVTPTLDLVRQWHDGLAATFGVPVGIIGGGDYDLRPLTVTTYDSAYLHMENLGARFGLLVFDECHHLPSASYSLSARLALAPFRLGLTATPERDAWATRGLAPEGAAAPTRWTNSSAPSSTARTSCALSGELPLELRNRAGRRRSLARRARGIRGRARAVSAVSRRQRHFHGQPARVDRVHHPILAQCRRPTRLRSLPAPARDRVHRPGQAGLRGTAAAPTSPRPRHHLHPGQRHRASGGQALSLPAITHQTRVSERSEILDGLAKGRYTAIATSKVLNEGVDVPEANVAIVMSGSGSVREHVQRLGRILRKRDGKQAILYELVAGGTSETFTSQRRREHIAYR